MSSDSAGSFEDVAAIAGVQNNHRGRGAIWGDYDNDGDLDLYVANDGDSDALYRNNGEGYFTNVAQQAGIQDEASESFEPLFFDYDNDGDLDLYVARGGFTEGEPNALYRNNGDGSFTEVAREAGVADSRASFSVTTTDYDHDGYLDLYVGNGEASERPTNTLYHNDGDGTFSDVTRAAGLEHTSNTHDVTFLDYDNDGFPDLYEANGGMISEQAADRLYRNNGNGTFTETTVAAGVEDDVWSMSVVVGDYNRDGYADIYVTHWNSGRWGTANALYRNNRDGTFTDVAHEAGVDYVGGSIGGAFGDYDNDGDVDLYVTTGGPMVVQSNLLYRNNGDGSFTEVSRNMGVRHLGNGHAAIFGDYDNDGHLDIYLTNGGRDAGQPNALYRNRGNRNHWLQVKMQGTRSNRSAIGARVRVVAGTSTYFAEVGGSSGFGGQNNLVIHFGLGFHRQVDQLEIEWPSGVQQDLEGFPADQVTTVTEGLSGERIEIPGVIQFLACCSG